MVALCVHAMKQLSAFVQRCAVKLLAGQRLAIGQRFAVEPAAGQRLAM